ncbi:MAG: hypothetical protein OEY84_07475 [Rhodospirillaceae bacterium]|nr:hypothetical protein [Rhodospirillaceae bacterium]
MKHNTNTKPAASLSASLLARKGEAVPAVAATLYNNPSLAWGGDVGDGTNSNHHAKRIDTTPAPAVVAQKVAVKQHSIIKKYLKPLPRKGDSEKTPSISKSNVRQKGDSVALILNIEEENYMRLKYKAQISGKSSQEIVRKAIERYLDDEGMPHGHGWTVKPPQ